MNGNTAAANPETGIRVPGIKKASHWEAFSFNRKGNQALKLARILFMAFTSN